jgi:hypothetical protein
MLFLVADLSNAKLVPVEDPKEWVLGVALAQSKLPSGSESLSLNIE